MALFVVMVLLLASSAVCFERGPCMSNEALQLIGAGVGAVVIAALAYIVAWLRAHTLAIAANTAAILKAGGQPPPRSARATDLVAAALPGRAAPLWNQLNDPLPNGQLPSWRYEECGEECCAEVICAQHGVEISADALRAQLGGPGRRGLTTGADLARILARANVQSAVMESQADNAPEQIQAATTAGRMVIALGHWLDPQVLHWVLVTRSDKAGCSYNDPWGGRRISTDWHLFAARYAGELVVVLRSPDVVS